METFDLFSTIVGSHMWGMQSPKSDVDGMQIYQQDTKSILSGYSYKSNLPSTIVKINEVDYDTQYMEIGHLIDLLVIGNVNAIWTVTSPLVVTDYIGALMDLRQITVNNLSKLSFPSIKGMSVSLYNDDIKRPGMPPNKAYKSCLRVLKFGINLFNTGTIKYEPVTSIVTKDEIDNKFGELKESFEHTKLPETPDEKVFREFLYIVRTSEHKKKRMVMNYERGIYGSMESR